MPDKNQPLLASLSIRFISGTKAGVFHERFRIPDGVSQPNPTLRREMLSEDIERHAHVHSFGFCLMARKPPRERLRAVFRQERAFRECATQIRSPRRSSEGRF